MTDSTTKKPAELESLRADIDRSDEAIVGALRTRLGAVRRIAEVKRLQGLPVYDAVREASLLYKLRSMAGSDVEGVALPVYRTMMAAARRFEAQSQEAGEAVSGIFCQFDFTGFFTPKMFMVVFSLLLVNIFDTIGTVLGLVSKLGIKENEKGEIPGVKEAMMSDAIGTTAGALLGSSTITTYVESASGVAEGGKSGLTSFFVGLMFILSIFLAPIFLLIPSAATSGALVMVGVLMIDSFKKIELEDISESFPAFITMITMVLCYSIADGICLGILSYVLIKMMVGRTRLERMDHQYTQHYQHAGGLCLGSAGRLEPGRCSG